MRALRFSLGAVTAAVLAGCSTTPDTAWRIEPTLQIKHAGGKNAGQGYVALARQYEGERRFVQALDAWRKAALEAPYDVEILNELAMAEAAQGHAARAVAALRRAVVFAPERAPLVNNLGYALLLEGRVVEARQMFRLALAIDPQHAQAKLNLAQSETPAGTAVAAAAPAAAPAAPTPTPTPVEPASPSNEPSMQVRTMPDAPALQVVSAEPIDKTPALSPAPQLVTGNYVIAPVVSSSVQAAPAALAPAVTAAPAILGPAVSAEPPVAAPAAPKPAPGLDTVRIEITNGNGVRGMAGWLRGWLAERGLGSKGRLSNLPPYQTAGTVVHYREGYAAQAREIARRMPLSVEVAPHPNAQRADVRVVLGHDMRESAACTAQGCGQGTLPAVRVAAR